MKRGSRGRSRSIPLLGPGAEAQRLLSRMPIAQLRAAAEQREIAIPPRTTRPQLARLLVRHASLERAETQYRETGIAFDSREAAYPHICRLVTRYRLRRVLDIGCGPGLFAAELRRALPRDGWYVGIDVSPAAVDLARNRLANDARFAFHVGDAEHLDDRAAAPADGVVISFVLSYLDTRAVHRLVGRLARMHPRATLIAALTFRSCVDRLEKLEANETRELRAARRYLAGDSSAARALWDLRRLVHYRASLETYYRIVDEKTLSPLAQMLWVGRPRSVTRR